MTCVVVIASRCDFHERFAQAAPEMQMPPGSATPSRRGDRTTAKLIPCSGRLPDPTRTLPTGALISTARPSHPMAHRSRQALDAQIASRGLLPTEIANDGATELATGRGIAKLKRARLIDKDVV